MAERLLDARGELKLADDAPAAELLLAGDLCPIERLDPMLAGGDVATAFGDTLALFRSADAAAVNIESPLCRANAPIRKDGPNFRCDPAIAAALASAGVGLACLANNHIMDQGQAGLVETIDALEAAGVAHVGASDARDGGDPAGPVLLERGGLRIAVVNIAEGEFSRMRNGAGAAGLDPVANCDLTRRAAASADLAVVVMHAGNELMLFPSPRMRQRCRELIDAGAAAVVCHHAHVPQGIEVYRGRPIAYSLGNFLFDWPQPEPETDSSFLLTLRVARSGVTGLAVHPIGKSAGGGAHLLAGRARADFVELLNDLSQPLNAPAQSARLYWLWEQQCVRVAEKRYFRVLRRIATAEGDAAAEKAAPAAWNLLNCEAHHEALRTLARLRLEGRLAPAQPEAGELDALMARLMAFATSPQGPA
ncbi:MAG: hypothetical protein BIFFINMI_02036 [Phycisphaerae bacterium]|nr:hypothetical protein [Phycisphaerae bacterium]